MTNYCTPTLDIPSGPWTSNDNVISIASKKTITQFNDDEFLTTPDNGNLPNLDGRLTYIHISDDCIAQIIDVHLDKPFSDKGITEAGWIGFQFALSGNQVSIVDGYGQMVHSGPRFGVCATSHATKAVKYIQPGYINYVNIIVRPAFLLQQFGLDPQSLPQPIQAILAGKNEGFYTCSHPLNSLMSNASEALLKSSFSGKLFETFAKIKIMELLCFASDMITQQHQVSQCKLKLSERDIMLLNKVREDVQVNFADPAPLTEISRKIGLNRNKLSLGFKELFGTGVYEYCQQYRMLQAKKLLQETTMSILEIAIEVGFQNHSSFSRAYKDFYDRAPSQDRAA